MVANNIYFVFLITIIIRQCTNCVENIESKKPLPYFRRKVEEITDTTVESKTDDPQGQLVSFLVKNAKKIFTKHKTIEISVPKYTFWPSKRKDTTILNSSIVTTPIPILRTDSSSCSTHAYRNLSTHDPFENKGGDVMQYSDLKLTPLPFLSDDEIKIKKARAIFTDEDLKSSKVIDESPLDKEEPLTFNIDSEMVFKASLHDKVNTTTSNLDIPEVKEVELHRSCIFCDNVAVSDCSNPKNKLIPSIVCPNSNDVCFTQHTPFGIVTRGCFNFYLNLTTYVCSCNLCNYFGFGEMPRIFPNQKDWVDNIIELSRTRGFRKNIFKDMSCLSCEVNGTTDKNRKIPEYTDLNCLEGKIGSLPTQNCNENEICGVKAIKGSSYVWRGCIKRPLYNYWLSLCNHDLCNYEPIKSIYEE